MKIQKLKYNIAREHFEKLAKAHATRVTAPLIQALETAGITIDDLGISHLTWWCCQDAICTKAA